MKNNNEEILEGKEDMLEEEVIEEKEEVNVDVFTIEEFCNLKNLEKYYLDSFIMSFGNVIKKSIKESIYEFDHTGTYIIRSSSCFYLKTDASNYAHHGPFVAFNNQNTKNKKDFFLCDMPNQNYKQNSNYAKYIQFPYAFGLNTPASYIGGGSQSNTYSTMVNKSNIKGEWIQIKLPDGKSNVIGKGRMYLTKYGISTPTNWNAPVSFPKNFVVVGSNEGLDNSNWELVDQQNLDTIPDISTQPIEFKVVTSSKYTYFRLIVLELFKNYPGVFAIKQWKLYGTPDPPLETFETMNTAYKYHEFKKFTTDFINFNLSIPIENIKYNQEVHGLNRLTEPDVYIGATMCVLAISVWIYSLFGK
jgi:hypothetical protein